MKTTLIKNASIVNEDEIFVSDILVENGIIKQVERDCIRTVSKYNKNIAKLKIRLEEMEKRYNEKL